MIIPFSMLRKVSLILTAFLLLFAIQAAHAGRFGDPDGYYHVQMARWIASNRLPDQFTPLPFTTWGQNYADQHFLYHVILVPFVAIDPIWGTKLATALLAAAAFTAFWHVARSLGAAGAWFWALITTFGSVDFLLRISLAKSIGLSVALLLLFTLWYLQKKYVYASLITFAFVWTYGGFVFMFPVAACILLSQAITGRRLPKPAALLPFTAIIAAIAAHPQRGHLIGHLYDQIFQAGLGHVIPVGVEWYPYSLAGFLSAAALPAIVYAFAIFILIKQKKNTDAPTLSLLLISLASLLLAFRSRRFIEYWVPFSMLFSGLILTPYIQKVPWTELPSRMRKETVLISAFISCTLGFILIFSFSILTVIQGLARAKPAGIYRPAALYLSEHAPAGAIVFDTQWDQFPPLFFWNDKQRFITGLDPTFLYLADRERYWLWRHISDDELLTCPAERCEGDLRHALTVEEALRMFGAKYLFIEKDRNPQLARITLPAVFQDGKIIIFQVPDL